MLEAINSINIRGMRRVVTLDGAGVTKPLSPGLHLTLARVLYITVHSSVLYCTVHHCQPNISIITPDSYTVLIVSLLIVLPSRSNLMAVSGTFQKSRIPSIQSIHHERFRGNSTQKVGQKIFQN